MFINFSFKCVFKGLPSARRRSLREELHTTETSACARRSAWRSPGRATGRLLRLPARVPSSSAQVALHVPQPRGPAVLPVLGQPPAPLHSSALSRRRTGPNGSNFSTLRVIFASYRPTY